MTFQMGFLLTIWGKVWVPKTYIWHLLSCLLSYLPSNEKLLLALKKSLMSLTRCDSHQHSYSSCNIEMNAYCRQKGTKGSLCMQLPRVLMTYWFENILLINSIFPLNKKTNKQNISPSWLNIIKCNIPPWPFGVNLEIILYIPNK